VFIYTVCPTCYRTWHFFNNSNTNEDIATKFEEGYVRCVRNEEECVCSAPNIISGKIIKEMLGSVASGTHCTYVRVLLHSMCSMYIVPCHASIHLSCYYLFFLLFMSRFPFCVMWALLFLPKNITVLALRVQM
jgi:hypothetical protein